MARVDRYETKLWPGSPIENTSKGKKIRIRRGHKNALSVIRIKTGKTGMRKIRV